MKAIGLYPSHSGELDGKETGQKMDQYLLTGGPFDTSCDALIAQGFSLKWFETITDPLAEAQEAPVRKPLKVNWICPECNDVATAKASARFACMRCGVALLLQSDLQAIEMESAPAA